MSSDYDGKLPGLEATRSRLPDSVQAATKALGIRAAYAVLALAVGRLLQIQIQLGNTLGFDRPSLAWSALFLTVTALGGIVIHEGGHYLAGAALGLHCRRLVIGPFEWARGADGWAARWVPIRRAGLVDLVPSTFTHFRLHRAICVAGGPMASLLSGLVFAELSLHAHLASFFWIWSFCVQWSFVGLIGLAPIRRGAARSDGYLLGELIRGGPAVEELRRNLLMASSLATTPRIRG